MTEPTIVTALRADHEQGLHSVNLAGRPNAACPECLTGESPFSADVPPSIRTMLNLNANRRIE